MQERSISDLFDPSTMAQLRALRRDRSLTIGGGWRPCAHPSEETGELLTDLIVWMGLEKRQLLAGCSTTPPTAATT